MKLDWKKFFKYELIALLIVGLLYFNSVRLGNNIFPENFYIVFLIPALFGIMMLLKTHTVWMERKLFRPKNQK